MVDKRPRNLGEDNDSFIYVVMYFWSFILNRKIIVDWVQWFLLHDVNLSVLEAVAIYKFDEAKSYKVSIRVLTGTYFISLVTNR